jgi:hypothetical protein
MARTKGGRKKSMTNLQARRKYHDEHLEKHNIDGKKRFTRPGSHKK